MNNPPLSVITELQAHPAEMRWAPTTIFKSLFDD
jgi:hypothetical protein